MTRLDIPYQRLLNQHIAQPTLRRPDEIVGWLGAVQAQDYPGAKWALGLRLQGATDQAIEQAFAQGAILRTHVLRPTWHFVTPADIRWLLALTAPRVHTANAHMYRRLELDRAIFKRSHAALIKALQGGRQLTRDELRVRLNNAGVEIRDGLRMSYVLMHAELEGIICSDARRGRQFTYALLDERAPQVKTLERDEALVRLAHGYFVSRGPATVQDFAKWSGLTLTEARRGLTAIQAQLQQTVADGQTYWFAAPKRRADTAAPSAHLLSIYDEYISSYKDRRAIVAHDHAARLRALGNALSAIVVVDGQIVGTWKRTLTKEAVLITTNLFATLTSAQRQAVAAAAQRYGEFLGQPVVMSSGESIRVSQLGNASI